MGERLAKFRNGPVTHWTREQHPCREDGLLPALLLTHDSEDETGQGEDGRRTGGQDFDHNLLQRAGVPNYLPACALRASELHIRSNKNK